MNSVSAPDWLLAWPQFTGLLSDYLARLGKLPPDEAEKCWLRRMSGSARERPEAQQQMEALEEAASLCNEQARTALSKKFAGTLPRSPVTWSRDYDDRFLDVVVELAAYRWLRHEYPTGDLEYVEAGSGKTPDLQVRAPQIVGVECKNLHRSKEVRDTFDAGEVVSGSVMMDGVFVSKVQEKLESALQQLAAHADKVVFLNVTLDPPLPLIESEVGDAIRAIVPVGCRVVVFLNYGWEEPRWVFLATRLFSSGARTRTSSRRYNEPTYSFLNTSGWPSVARVREFWEGWFAHYDEDKKPALAARFQSANNHILLSAFLELFTFAVLRRAEYSVQIDPPAGTRTLDFLASSGHGPTFYAECTATGRRVAEVGEDAREADVIDAIDKVPSGQLVLGVRCIERGAESAPLRQLRSSLTTWLSTLNQAETREWTWRARGWVVQVTAIPAGDDPLEDQGGVGMIMSNAFTNDQPLRLRAAIDGKASKYGSLDKPLLVVTDSTEHQWERDLMTALRGDVIWHINFANKTYSVGARPNGIFSDTRGSRNVALSAVMHGHFAVLSFADRAMILIHHPFARHPLPFGLFTFCEERRFHLETGEPQTTAPATTVGGFFGLPDGWPFFELDPC